MNPLEKELRRLEKGPVAPDGAWIEVGSVYGRDWRQVYWRSETRCFPGRNGGMVKRKYIGQEGSPRHKQALEAVANRERISKIRRILSYNCSGMTEHD